MKPSIVLKLKSRKAKLRILSNAKKLRGSDVYINEQLTRQNADLARKARQYRRKGLILSTWTKTAMSSLGQRDKLLNNVKS